MSEAKRVTKSGHITTFSSITQGLTTKPLQRKERVKTMTSKLLRMKMAACSFAIRITLCVAIVK